MKYKAYEEVAVSWPQKHESQPGKQSIVGLDNINTDVLTMFSRTLSDQLTGIELWITRVPF